MGGAARAQRWGVSQEKVGLRQAPSPPTCQLFEFDGTNTSTTAAEPPGKPYPPYPLAKFFWDNITDSLDPATLSATFRGRPIDDPTGAFANGSLAFRVRMWGLKNPKAGFRGRALGVAFEHRRPPTPPGPHRFHPRCRPSPGPAGQPSPRTSCTQRTPAS